MAINQLKALVDHLSANRRTLPIHRDEICAWLLEKKIQDSIEFLAAPFDPIELEGTLIQIESTRNGKPVRRGVILTAVGLDPIQRRFVECKELMHLLDGHRHLTTPSQLDDLLEFLITPDNFIDGNSGTYIPNLPKGGTAERIAYVSALLALVPLGSARDILRKRYREGLPLATISQLLGIPEKYVQGILSSHFEEAAELILK